MPDTLKFLVFAGSTRTDSYNKKLAKLVEKNLRNLRADVTHIDLRDFPMPLYDGDLEAAEGIPENALKFRELLKCHHAFAICAPEYNSSISGVLKNTIDWASRPKEGEIELVCFKGKVVSLMSASPGRWGGLRGLVTVKSILGNIGSIVTPDQLCISFADKAFDSENNLVDKFQQELLDKMCKDFVKLVTKIGSEANICVEGTQIFT